MRYIILLVFVWITTAAVAQKRPTFGSMYFQHQYLANPAMAGVDSGVTVYVAHRQQLARMNGAPNAQALAATYQLNGFRFGVNAASGNAGVFTILRAAASVTYSQQLGDNNQFLHLGISYGGYGSNIRLKDVEGDLDDPLLQNFNSRKTFFDGDIGLAYTNSKLTVQASVPGFTTAFKKGREDMNGQMQLFTAVSYSFGIPDVPGATITPKACYRLLKNNDGVADFGAKFNFAQYRFGIEGIYHTNSAVTAGLNIKLLPGMYLLCMYFSESPMLQGHTKGNVEFGLKASF